MNHPAEASAPSIVREICSSSTAHALRLFSLAALVVAACSSSTAEDGAAVPDGGADVAVIEVEFEDSATHSFSPSERAAITAISEATYSEVQELLPDLTQQVTIVVAAGTQVIPETGEVGATLTQQRISWTVDPSRPGGVEQVASGHLRSTLFHELHHAVRGYAIQGPGRPTSFMDYVVSEGLASVFERDEAADRQVLWAEYPDDVETWVAELLALPLSAPYADWMFEHPDGRRWIGYRAGSFIVDQATSTSGKSAADLVDTSTQDILDLAGYS